MGFKRLRSRGRFFGLTVLLAVGVLLAGLGVSAGTSSAGVSSASAVTYHHLALNANPAYCIQNNAGDLDLQGCGGQSSQEWAMSGGIGNWGTIVSEASGKCVDDSGGDDNIHLDMAPCDGDSDQQWLMYGGTGGFICNEASGGDLCEVMTDDYGGQFNGAWVIGLKTGSVPASYQKWNRTDS